MEVAESRDPASVGPPTGADTSTTNEQQNLFLDDSLVGDDRSSSLSEIDEMSDNMPSDYESPRPDPAPAPENDSEAETERVDDSPNNVRSRTNIVVSATSGYEPSPSKLVQSTTYDEVDDDEAHPVDDSPTKPRSKPPRSVEPPREETLEPDGPVLSDSVGKKRKRLGSGEDAGATEADDEGGPPQKRRGSLKSELSDPPADDIVLTPEPVEEEPSKTTAEEDNIPADNAPESDLPAAPVKGKKGKKGKRKGRKTRDADEDVDGVGDTEGGADDHTGDDDTAERGEEADDGEAAARLEEEAAKRTSAMESLAGLEREFATLRDKIYDERISKLNNELDMLKGPNPTHPDLLRQLECLQRYRDDKIHYEHTLFQYRLKSLLNKSLAERAQAHSTYFQRIRDLREKHSTNTSKQFYAIQHDRFKTDELSPQQYIPFPTRRSQQIAQQTAYNQEVSVLAGVAKYVGFPAAPSLSAARPSELEDDLEKMGIVIEPKAPVSQPPTTMPRGPMSAMSSNVFRTAAEEAFLEQTPWANPLHPAHQQQTGSQKLPGRAPEDHRAPAYTTPAGQKRVVDVNAPNGSASTIAENSSANNTPYGMEQDAGPSGLAPMGHVDYDAARRSGFRSLSSSPLDVRKPHPAAYGGHDHRSPPGAGQHAAYSPPPARLGLFHSAASRRESSPSMSSKAVNSMGVLGGPGSNQMAAR